MSDFQHPDAQQEALHRTWMDGLQRIFILDEHPEKLMPRTVRAQVGFGALLICIQFVIDMLAWTLGLRWVFVEALGVFAGWPLTILFAFLISSAIAVFERFVLTADTSKKSLLLSPAVLVRLSFIVVAVLVTSIPMEMMIFDDVIQGKIGAEVSVLRDDARKQLRADVEQDIKGVDTAIAAAEAARLAPVDRTIAELQSKIFAISDQMQSEQEGKRNGGPGQGPRYLSLKAQREEMQVLLDAQLEKRQQLVTSNEGQSAQLATLLATRERHVSRLNMQLTDKELSLLTQRTLKVPDGFARRWELMKQLEEENPIYEQTKWAIRMVFLALGLLVFTTKLFFNDATVQYYTATQSRRDHLRPLPSAQKAAPPAEFVS